VYSAAECITDERSYPSLLESSDVRGGSTSAVLTYLCRVLESIDQPKLIHRTLQFLMAAPTYEEPVVEVPQSLHNKNLSLSRRKSLDVLATLAEAEEQRLSPSLFNLADLVLISIKSRNKETVVATLRLLTVIVRRHHSFAESLIKTKEPVSGPRRTVGALNEELQRYMSFATRIVDDSSLNDSFEKYSKDATLILESRLFIPSPRSSILDGPTDQPLDICLDDAIFKEIVNLLDNFFSNSVNVNLGLTGLITSLASSNLISLNGWLLVDPSNYEYETDLEPVAPVPDENTAAVEADAHITDPLAAIRRSLAAPSWSDANETPIAKSLQKLAAHLEKWRKEIPEFDILVAARRDLLHGDDARTERSIPSSRQTSQPPNSRSTEAPLSPRGRPISVTTQDGSFTTPSSLPRNAVGSPFREPSIRSPGSPTPSQRPVLPEDISRRLSGSYRIDQHTESSTSTDVGSKPTVDNQTDAPDNDEEEHKETLADDEKAVTLGHILTNVVILYEFILELSAMVQIRATIFEEAGYD
jgi:Retinoic acid induced 16-like protein/Family of unknown function (DUF5917)